MSDTPLPADVHTILAQIPLLAGANTLHIAPLQGVVSLNNANYKVTADQSDYILRIATDSALKLGIRRIEEREAALAAAKAKVGPEVFYFDDKGHCLTAYIKGRHWQAEDFQQEPNLIRLAETLHRLHDVRHVASDGSVYRRVERLLESALSLGIEPPKEIQNHRAALARIEAKRHADPRFVAGLSHNDFWSNNFLDDGTHLWLVDWEFGGNGDGLYDLATAALAGGYSNQQKRLLLKASGYHEAEDLESLNAMQFVIWFFEGAWAMVQHALRGSNDFNYHAYATTMFQKMEQYLAEASS